MKSNMPFEGKIALVTGSGRGIGRAIAVHLASLGADVVVNYFRNDKSAQQTQSFIEAMRRRSLLVKANIGEIDGINNLFDEIGKNFGGLDILVHNAASGYNRSVMQQRPKGWDWTMNINARAFLFASQRAAELMETRGGGHIIGVSSAGAHRVLPDYVVVGASKAAIESITRYLAVELAPRNIIVNAVSPGLVETDALKHFNALSDSQLIEITRQKTPAGRLTTPEDVAGLIAFLCSPGAFMIRGQVITMDGGYTLNI